MKLASIRSESRDGALAVIDSEHRRGVLVPEVANSLIDALERWDAVAPDLRQVAVKLDEGACSDAFNLADADLVSPLPRSPQFLDGSVYLHHMQKARAARGASMPANFESEPLMYQGTSDRYVAPVGALELPDESLELDYEPEIAVITDDVPMGVTSADAVAHVKLVVLLNDYTLRALTRTELPRGFGFLQAKPTSSFGPIALTPDELGDAWRGAKVHLRVHSHVNDEMLGSPNAGIDMFFSYADLIAHAARTRHLSAGTIIGAGSISNQDEAAGFGCIAEARIDQELTTGKAVTAWLKHGDRVRIEAFDVDGRSVFGAIDNAITPPR